MISVLQRFSRLTFIRIFVFFLFLFSVSSFFARSQAVRIDKRTQCFDDNWLFLKTNDVDAYAPLYNDSRWRKVHLPHDWSIEDLAGDEKDSAIGPFSRKSAGGAFTGHTVGGTAWYRKKFSLPPSSAGPAVYIRFDGVYTLTEVWINGQYLGYHPNGYTPFFYNIAAHLNPPGRPNVLAVRVRNEGRNSRWYSGSGIYRHVWLTVVTPVHIVPFGIHVTTPVVDSNLSLVRVATAVALPHQVTNITTKTVIRSPDGSVAGTISSPLESTGDSMVTVTQQLSIRKPLLWSPAAPALYKAVTYIFSGNRKVDSSETVFGFRSVEISADKGLLLNGKRIILKGGCLHHDHGPLGAAAVDRADERRLEILKANGFNAIRTSHNPPSPYFLDVCDRLGFLVIDEAFDVWEHKKLFEDSMDYHHYFKEWWQMDLRAFVKRDRNHPSVLMWSIGNEIYERADTSGIRIAKQLIAEIRTLDSARHITQGLCWFWDHPGRPWDSLQPAFALLDVGGYNYEYPRYKEDHRKFPTRIMAGTETYPKDAFANFDFAEKNPYVLGDFVWTAWDYIGEAGIGHTLLHADSVKEDKTMLLPWPWFNAWCGDLDLTGQKKPQSYYRDVVWRNSRIELMVQRPAPEGMHYVPNNWGWPEELKSWTWTGHEEKKIVVRVFSRSQAVRLLLNDSIIGEEKVVDSTLTATFNITYAPGRLKALALEGGEVVGSDSLRTAGVPARIRLTADRKSVGNGYNEIVYVSAEVIDSAGNVVPDTEIPLQFAVSRAGSIVATASGNPRDMSSFQRPLKKTFGGRALVTVRPTSKGRMVVSASSPGLADGRVVIDVR